MSKKGENIYKRRDGRWEARYIKSHTPGGRVKYGYCYGKTYHEAREKVNCAKAGVMSLTQRKKVQKDNGVSTCCDEWLQLRRGRLKESTYVKYQTILEKHIKPRLGNYGIQSLSSPLIGQFGYDLLHREGLSVKTVRDILAVLSSVLKYIAKQYPFLPAIEVVYPKEENREMRVLSREEERRLVRFLLADADTCKFGTLLALLTGLRIGEICALKWENISLAEGTLRVTSTMQRLKNLGYGAKTKIVISEPKSFSSARVIPLSPFALELCRRFCPEDPSAYILTGSSVRFIEPRSLQYRMAHYVKDCGLEGVHFHSLRHSFATRCVEVGFEIKSLSEILGHASPQITLERYVHSSIELKRENMNKLAAIGY